MNREQREQEKGCVIIPCYMEETKIHDVVKKVKNHINDVVVIDDGSTDKTSEQAARAGAVVCTHNTNMGKGTALNTGFRYVRDHHFDYVITMDGDGQHAPSDIPEFIDSYIRTGIPVLIGNRMSDLKNMPLIRILTNRLMSWFLSKTMGQYVADTQCGFRLYRCDVIPFVSARSERYAAESEILLHIALRNISIGSVPIQVIYTDEKSKIKPGIDTLRFFKMLYQYRGYKPKRRSREITKNVLNKTI
jgi:glycosyltransferase involved in cell wall biosynthesis